MEFSVKSGPPKNSAAAVSSPACSSRANSRTWRARSTRSAAARSPRSCAAAISTAASARRCCCITCPTSRASACCSSVAARKKEFSDARYRDVTAKAVAALKDTGATEATSYLTELEVKGRDITWKVRQAVEMTQATLYRFDRLKSKPDNHRRALKRVVLAVPKRSDLGPGERAIREAQAVAGGVKLARATLAICRAMSAHRPTSPSKPSNSENSAA